jgi:hypothetical protein
MTPNFAPFSSSGIASRCFSHWWVDQRQDPMPADTAFAAAWAEGAVSQVSEVGDFRSALNFTPKFRENPMRCSGRDCGEVRPK